MAAEKGWTVSHMDVNTAYLNSELKEDIYLLSPKGIPGSNNKQKVWKLCKAIYGLKQRGREWNEKLNTEIKAYRMRRIEADPYVYGKRKRRKYCNIYRIR